MKHLIRRLSRVADSSSSSSQSNYCLLRSDSTSRRPGRAHSFRAAAASKFRRSRSEGSAAPVPQGHVPVYVGEEMERFAVSAELLNHPVFVRLLEKSAQEYGYEQKGVLRIPCHVLLFERVLEAIRIGDHHQDLLISSLLSPATS